MNGERIVGLIPPPSCSDYSSSLSISLSVSPVVISMLLTNFSVLVPDNNALESI